MMITQVSAYCFAKSLLLNLAEQTTQMTIEVKDEVIATQQCFIEMQLLVSTKK